jgi:hypothetical protein
MFLKNVGQFLPAYTVFTSRQILYHSYSITDYFKVKMKLHFNLTVISDFNNESIMQ